MGLPAYYNEYDKNAAKWLNNLIGAGHVASGKVDDRSIVAVRPADLAGSGQAHFFAGIGIWSAAFRRAGIPDTFPAWSASCPCQPFSTAGKRKGKLDARHLWPDFHKLVARRRPPIIFGEQVASPDGLDWLDSVLSDLERSEYAAGAIDTCAASVGAPHIRQRLYWCAFDPNADFAELEQAVAGNADVVGNADGKRESSVSEILRRSLSESEGRSGVGLMADVDIVRAALPVGVSGSAAGGAGELRLGRGASDIIDNGERPGPVNGFWSTADWLSCRDGQWRAVEVGTQPLADVDPGRVGKLRAYGSAIVLEQATEFVKIVVEYLTTDNVDDY